ncbi:hypothetical protein DV711_16765 [Motiliproteus coralliicola]|uniref:Type II/III secretion system secretin-like domain-containing protein n=1 Tax=Motiliproteus coralliicola TaxID=2283196 RepID=A0A369W8T1_9GAMM|nr:hypothetical protein [Motiliproteus coralliicola]RDE18312.1 hypothetical protein DV711_16765 [Motiliproteus coralliicola]
MKIKTLVAITTLLVAFCPLPSTAAKPPKINLVEFKDASVKDATRILSSMTGANIAVTREAHDARIDLRLQNVELKHAIEMLSRVSGLWFRYNKRNNSYLIMTEQQYQDDIVVYRDDEIRSFVLKHQNVRATALTIQSLFGDRVILKLQDDRDDFEGIPSGYLESITDQTSSSSNNSNSGSNNRVTVNNNNDSNSSSNGGNLNYASKGDGEIKTLRPEDEDRDPTGTKLNQKLNTAQLNQLGSAQQVNADTAGKKLGIKTPIFIATNRIHNLLFVRTSDRQAMADIEDLIETSDKPTPQVLLETKIIRIDQADEFTQDFDLSFNDALNVPGASYANGTTLSAIQDGTATINLADGTSLNNADRILEQLRGNSVTQFGFNGLTGGFYQFYSKYINAKIELLEENDAAEIIAKPILLASNNRPSRLFIGEDQVIATGIDAGSTTTNNNNNNSTTTTTDTELETEVRKVGNTLALLPSINDDGTVTIDILQSTSELKRAGMNFPFFNALTGQIESVALDTVAESTLKTVVVAQDGFTIALGGMINQTDRDDRSTIPVLGDLPILGKLFQTRNTVESEAQYIMLITPHIIETPDEADEKTREIRELDYQRHDETSQEQRIEQGQATSGNGYDMNDLIALNRHVANRLRGATGPDHAFQPLPAPEPGRAIQLGNPALEANPVGAYRHKNLYLTVVEVQNRSDQDQPLEIRHIPGSWISIARNKALLKGVGGNHKEHALLYFTSAHPFSIALLKDK